MKWKTSISNSTENGCVIRGENLTDLIGKVSFSEAIFLVLQGKLPSESEKKMMDAILVSTVDHGVAVPAVTVARTVASTGQTVPAALGAGISAIGEHWGGATEKCARLLQENKDKPVQEVVAQAIANKKRLPGFGHKLYKEDPRTKAILSLAKELNFSGPHVTCALAIEEELEKQKGKKLCLNIDGCIAAVMSDMGLNWRLGKSLFAISRIAGLAAHVYEEQTKEKPYRRLPKEDIEFSNA